MGECPPIEDLSVPEIKTDCLRPCPAIYAPICGFDGVTYHTYGNMCEFEMMNCNSENRKLNMILSQT